MERSPRVGIPAVLVELRVNLAGVLEMLPEVRRDQVVVPGLTLSGGDALTE